MKLEKLTITPQSPSKLKEIEVLFNPTSYSISKSVGWNSPGTTGINSGVSSSGGSSENQNEEQTRRGLNAPQVAFGGGSARQLSLELFYDTTLPIEGITPMSDVRNETNKIVELSRIERDKEKPPVCLVSWGAPLINSDFPFKGVITSLTQKFTLFTSSGVPLRANLTVSFREYLAPEEDKKKTDPVFTTRIIKAGDTLSSIAAEIYRDPTRWRIIAEENSIDDPRRLNIGQMLSIPKLSR